MHNNDEPVIVERSGGQIMGFLLGLAVGAGVALLFAPQSGAATRRQIASRARRARRAASQWVDDIKDRAEDAYEVARSETRRRMHEAREGIDDAITGARDRVDAVREAGRTGAKAAREDLQRRLSTLQPNGDDA